MEVEKQIAEIREDIGELKGITKMILEKLDGMERKYNGQLDKIVELEKKLGENSRLINDHLKWHRESEKYQKSWRIQYRAAIMGGAAGSVVSFILFLVYMLMM